MEKKPVRKFTAAQRLKIYKAMLPFVKQQQPGWYIAAQLCEAGFKMVDDSEITAQWVNQAMTCHQDFRMFMESNGGTPQSNQTEQKAAERSISTVAVMSVLGLSLPAQSKINILSEMCGGANG